MYEGGKKHGAPCGRWTVTVDIETLIDFYGSTSTHTEREREPHRCC